MTERTVTTNGVELHVVDEGPVDGPVVVLAHGFPELGYSWRHQIPVLAAAGFRVLAPDQRGYGRSSRPEAIADYDVLHLAGDLIGLLDDVGGVGDEQGQGQAVFVGHDWGAQVVWQLALLHPDRVRGVVGMSVPFLPRGPLPPVQVMRSTFGENFFYIVYFQEPGVADADLGADPATFLRRMIGGLSTGLGNDPDAAARMFAPGPAGFVERLPEPGGLPSWITPDEFDHYVSEFTRTGFTGGINWYRNFDRNWELTAHLDGAKVEAPSLFVGGAHDPVLLMTPPGTGDADLTDHRGNVIVDGAGHWVQQEKPDDVNAALLGFLRDL